MSEHDKKNDPISLESINFAVNNLYGGWDDFSQDSKKFIEDAINNGEFEKVYVSVRNEEIESKEILISFEHKYPEKTRKADVNEILKTLKAKQNGIK